MFFILNSKNIYKYIIKHFFVPVGKLEPSFFNAIPVDSQEARAGRRFNFKPQPAVPGASFELL